MSETDTERAQLMDIFADHAAQGWYKLMFPQAYAATRLVNNHQIVVVICNGETARKLIALIEEDHESLTVPPG